MKKKIASLFLVMALMLPMIPVPASASALVVPGGIAAGVTGIVTSAAVANGVQALKDLAYEYFAGEYTVDNIDKVYNCLVSIIGYGQMPMWKLQKKCDTLNAFSRHPNLYWEQFFQTGVDLGYWLPIDSIEPLFAIYTYFVCDFDNIIGGWQVVEFQDGQYVIANSDESFIFSDPLGRYPYASDYADTWFPAEDIEAGVVVAPVPEDALNRRLKECRNMYPNSNIYIGTITLDNGLDYKVIYENTGSDSPNVWCDYEAKPYALPLYDTQAGQDRDYNNDVADQPLVNEEPVTDIDENFILQMFPDGTFTWIDNIDFTYDDSNKVYNIDASTTYNIEENTYYSYSWSYTYYIDYTSITYIGQTEEYNERYEYYYTLPDGRSSADLTEEELQTLNTTVDVLPYIRSADDTSIRALYHFDGDTMDSSYWSHIGHFDWTKGASITYMDAGAFGGALYLDENEHEFSITLPSNIGSSDFTVQFRYYQSATLAPVFDSTVSIGNTPFIGFNGSSVLSGSGSTVLASLSTGVWNEICIMRKSGVFYRYINGVLLDSGANANVLSDVISFDFGSEQQTFKYIDELRVVNQAVYDTSGYTVSSVPFDTNLALVLPDSKLPVADEYWILNEDGNLLPVGNYLGLGSLTGVTRELTSRFDFQNLFIDYPQHQTGVWYYRTGGNLSLVANSDCLSFVNSGSQPTIAYNVGTGYTYNYFPSYFTNSQPYAFVMPIGYTVSYTTNNAYLFDGSPVTNTNVSFSLLEKDGNLTSITFKLDLFAPVNFGSYSSSIWNEHSVIKDLGNGAKLVVAPGGYVRQTESGRHLLPYFAVLIPPANGSLDVVYTELKIGEPNTGHEFVSSVVVMDKDDLRTPSLAVRTDIDITSYQIGGVRPSLPEKGLVWAMVESGRITSLQIYNGQAWEECDGRIWTGQRWIPYYAYDVLLLKDLYDVVGTDPTLNPIYTETGFWTWLQNAWKDMIARLDKLISVSGGGGVVVPDGSQDFPPDTVDPDGDDEEWTIIDLAVTVKDGVWSITKGVIRVGIGGFKGLVSGVSNISGFFDAFDESGILQIMDETGAVTWE